MIDWPKWMMKASGLGHQDTSEWIARRINKKLAGYEAAKKMAIAHIRPYDPYDDGEQIGGSWAGSAVVEAAQKAEADYEADHR